MNRRQVLAGALAVAATAVATRYTIGAAAAVTPSAHEGHGPGDMVVRTAAGWESHLLPFAAPFPTEAALKLQLAQSRRLGLFR
jgi:hypothetical protein